MLSQKFWLTSRLATQNFDKQKEIYVEKTPILCFLSCISYNLKILFIYTTFLYAQPYLEHSYY